jgi:type IV pilus assembly protein PilF
MSAGRLLPGLLHVAAALLLAACATTTTTTTSGVPTGDAEPRGRAAASEESGSTRRAQVRMELATAYFANGQMDIALEEVQRAIAANPTQSAPFVLRGLIQAGLGDDALAEASFRHALELNARDANAMHNFGGFLCQRKRYGEAFAMFDQALAVPQYRDAARTLLARGLCLAFDKQYGDAERSLSRSLELDPTNPSTATNLAEVLFRLGQYRRAQATIRRVNDTAGIASAQTLWLAARIERALGNGTALAEIGNRLRTQFPESPEAEAFDKGRFGD